MRWGFKNEYIYKFDETPLSFLTGNQSCAVRFSQPPANKSCVVIRDDGTKHREVTVEDTMLLIHENNLYILRSYLFH